jgi:uncharacterized protein YraI
MKFMELIMHKFLIVVLVGMGLLASQAYASELKIGSWGGNVRSGPSTEYPIIGSLKNGDPVVLLEKQRPARDGFNWFRIAYGSGQFGYQWGGDTLWFQQ